MFLRGWMTGTKKVRPQVINFRAALKSYGLSNAEEKGSLVGRLVQAGTDLASSATPAHYTDMSRLFAAGHQIVLGIVPALADLLGPSGKFVRLRRNRLDVAYSFAQKKEGPWYVHTNRSVHLFITVSAGKVYLTKLIQRCI